MYSSFGLAKYTYSCTSPTLSQPGAGNINADPKFLDLFHISSISPCYGTGSAVFVGGFDLDDELLNIAPSMGCDEVVMSNLVGPLSVNISTSQTNLLVNRSGYFWGNITGRASRVEWSFGDGPIFTNSGVAIFHAWTNSGDYVVTFRAYNNDNPVGVTNSALVHVQPLDVPQIQFIAMLTNGFQFRFPGQTNANYTIQYSTNLISPVTWKTLQTIFFNNQSLIQITDPTRTDSARLYRVLAQ